MTMPSALSPTPTLDVHRLSKRFTLHLRGGLQLPVLHDVSLQVAAGECVALVGASGQGKSTFVKCLYGSYGADAGRIVLQGDAGPIDLAQATPQQVLALRRRELAHVSQFLRTVPRVSALDVVVERLMDARPTPPASDDEGHGNPMDAGDDGQDAPHTQRLHAARDTVRALFERLRLPAALWDLPPATFSGGEQQRVNIARGFIQPSRLLLLDEPTASLDAANRRTVMQLIDEAKARGTAIVGIFHDEEVRDAVATRCVTLA